MNHRILKWMILLYLGQGKYLQIAIFFDIIVRTTFTQARQGNLRSILAANTQGLAVQKFLRCLHRPSAATLVRTFRISPQPAFTYR